MLNKLNFTYEAVGNSSYLVATLNESTKIINYQMQMLSNNKIQNILEASKKQKNDDIQIFYNVTSKLSLSQATSRQKISKQGFVNLINGVITAYNELSEYQLVSSGLVLDNEYVFVKTGTFEPSFIYVPINIEDVGIEPLKNFLLNLILKSMVEVTNDNFIHVILETLNSETLNIEELSKVIKGFGEKSSCTTPLQISPLKPNNNKIQVQERSEVRAENYAQPIPVNNKEEVNIRIDRPAPPIPARPQPSKGTGSGVNSKPEPQIQSAARNEIGGKKNIFLLLQLVFLAIIVGFSMSGALNNAEGQLEISYLGGVLLALGGTDFVLYREMFKNVKTDKKDVKKPAVNVTNGKQPFPPIPKPHMYKEQVQNKPYQESVKPKAAALATTVAPPIQIPVYAQPQPPRPVAKTVINSLVNEFESEDTVILTDEVAQGVAYLEYYENGLMTKVSLDKPNVLIGRLRGQVDFAVNNNKIGKIHAEFIAINGSYYVKDYNSTNGTYINSIPQRITSNDEVQIFNGDKIMLANSEFTLRC